MTVVAFGVDIKLTSAGATLAKGYGSPEISTIKPRQKHVNISSEFASAFTEAGEAKGAIYVFKVATAHAKVDMAITWRDTAGALHEATDTVVFEDRAAAAPALRKALAIIHFVDMQNAYIKGQEKDRKKRVSLFEQFLAFRDHFLCEIESCGDLSLATYNQGDLEMLDKILSIESNELKIRLPKRRAAAKEVPRPGSRLPVPLPQIKEDEDEDEAGDGASYLPTKKTAKPTKQSKRKANTDAEAAATPSKRRKLTSAVAAAAAPNDDDDDDDGDDAASGSSRKRKLRQSTRRAAKRTRLA